MSLTEKEILYSFTSLENSIKGLDKSNGGMDDNEMKEFLHIFFHDEYERLYNIASQMEDIIYKLENESEEKMAAQAELDKIEEASDKEYNKRRDIDSELITRDKLQKYMKEYLDSSRGKSFSKLPANNIYILTDRTKGQNFAIIKFSKRLINYMKKLLLLPYETSGRLDFGLKNEFQRGTFRFLSDQQEIDYKKDASVAAPPEISDDYELFYHIHPSRRVELTENPVKYEPPSHADIMMTIKLQFLSYIEKPSVMFQQHLVIAPEGIYTLMLTRNKLESMLHEVQDEYEQYKEYVANFIKRMDIIFKKKQGISFKEATEQYDNDDVDRHGDKQHSIYDTDYALYGMLITNGANILENGKVWEWEYGPDHTHPGHSTQMFDSRFYPDNKFVHPLKTNDLLIARRAFIKVLDSIKTRLILLMYPELDKDFLDLIYDYMIADKLSWAEATEDREKLIKIKTKGMSKEDAEKFIKNKLIFPDAANFDDAYTQHIHAIRKVGLFISLQKWNYKDLKEYPDIRFKIVPIENYDYDETDEYFNPSKINVEKYIKLK